ncbi:hypothetical protein NL676_022527 [Syzygium grande]|nr:hypothetical protein NL676_022527 [Syzygium grande]
MLKIHPNANRRGTPLEHCSLICSQISSLVDETKQEFLARNWVVSETTTHTKAPENFSKDADPRFFFPFSEEQKQKERTEFYLIAVVSNKEVPDRRRQEELNIVRSSRASADVRHPRRFSLASCAQGYRLLRVRVPENPPMAGSCSSVYAIDREKCRACRYKFLETSCGCKRLYDNELLPPPSSIARVHEPASALRPLPTQSTSIRRRAIPKSRDLGLWATLDPRLGALVKRGQVRESKLVQNFETQCWWQPKLRVNREGKKEKTERRDPALDDAIWGLARGGGSLASSACVRWSGLVVDWRSCTTWLLVGGGGGGGGGGEFGDEVAREAERRVQRQNLY